MAAGKATSGLRRASGHHAWLVYAMGHGSLGVIRAVPIRAGGAACTGSGAMGCGRVDRWAGRRATPGEAATSKSHSPGCSGLVGLDPRGLI
jgi:hypothetical protein